MGNRDALRAKNKMLQRERIAPQINGPETQVDEVLKGVEAEARKNEKANIIAKEEKANEEKTNELSESPKISQVQEYPLPEVIAENKEKKVEEILVENKEEVETKINLPTNTSQEKEEPVNADVNINKPSATETAPKVLEIKEKKAEKDEIKLPKKKVDKDLIKKTSLNISRSSLAYLAVNSKLAKINQNTLLSQIIQEEQDKKLKYKVDYSLVPTKTNKTNTTIKAVQLPESQLEFIKLVSAKKMKSVSDYVDELIQKKIEEETR